jgi:hypothetical protein
MFYKILTKHFKGFGSGFKELHAKLYSETLLDFVIHRRKKPKPEVEKVLV